MTDVAIVDVDGTLVDTNYQHALSWFRAFRRFDITVPVWHLHRAIGMGGDQLITHVAGAEAERCHGDQLREAHADEFDAWIGQVCAFADATALLDQLRTRGLQVVLATSGRPEHVDHFVDLIDGRRYAEAIVTSGDVAASKPAPDLIRYALDAVGGDSGVVIGDSVWDGQAAAHAGTPFVGVRTGGFSDDELIKAGAVTVATSLGQLRDELDHTPLTTAM